MDGGSASSQVGGGPWGRVSGAGGGVVRAEQDSEHTLLSPPSYEFMRRSLIFYRNEIRKMTGKVHRGRGPGGGVGLLGWGSHPLFTHTGPSGAVRHLRGGQVPAGWREGLRAGAGTCTPHRPQARGSWHKPGFAAAGFRIPGLAEVGGGRLEEQPSNWTPPLPPNPGASGLPPLPLRTGLAPIGATCCYRGRGVPFQKLGPGGTWGCRSPPALCGLNVRS